MMRRILVTGAAGYIGSHTVVELINAGYEPILLDDFSNSDPGVLDRIKEICNTELRFFEVDCTDFTALSELMASEKPDGVIHFAAYKAVGESVANPLKYYKNNVGGMTSLLSAMAANGVTRLVFSSSCTVYGQPDVLPADESSPVQEANSPYGYSKQVCERMACDVVNSTQHGFGAVLLRYFNPIGAHPSGLIGELPLGTPANLIPFLTQSAAGSRGPLTVFGSDYNTPDGSCIRDYIHVVDLAIAHIRALEWVDRNPGSCEAFNVGTGEGHSVLGVIRKFEEVTGVKVPYKLGERRPGDVEQIWASSSKAETELGWKAERNLEEMLRDAWNWQLKLKDSKWPAKA